MNLKKVTAALFVVTSLINASSFAQTTTTETETTLTFNVGLVTNYRYRGISQSGHKPALQFGEDYQDKTGFYVGNWNSTIAWIKDTADTSVGQTARGPLEMDFYGGYKGSYSEWIGYDVGILEYFYPTNNLSGVTNSSVNGVSSNFSNANTTELYGAVNFGAFVIKLSDSLTNLFGYVGSKNSTYVDLNYTFDFGDGMTSVVHYGNQSIKATNAVAVTSGVRDYNDYSLSFNKDFKSIVASATIIGTDWSKRGYAHTNDVLPGSGSTNLAGNTLVLGVKKNF